MNTEFVIKKTYSNIFFFIYTLKNKKFNENVSKQLKNGTWIVEFLY